MSKASQMTTTAAPSTTPGLPLASRRRLLAGSGLATISAALAMPAMASLGHAALTSLVLSPDHTDADLVRICAEHVINMDTFNRDGGMGLVDDADPLWDAYERTRDAISAAKPRTLAGLQAIAQAAKAEALTSRTDGKEMPEGTPAERWAWDLVNNLLALGAIA